jgi:hypothetical protein
MAVDIYLRIPTDPKFDPDQLEVEDDLENFVQYIEMLLTTNKGEVFGEPDFGANLDSYLWNTNVSVGSIKSDLNKLILKYLPDGCSKIPFAIDIGFIKGQLYDTMLVDIEIDGTKVIGIAATPQNPSLQNNFR